MDILYCILLVIFWHLIVFIFTTNLNCNLFYEKCSHINIKKNSRQEKFYDFLKIKKWKSKVPECVCRKSISGEPFIKRRFKTCKTEYVKDFIAETYIAELNHIISCMVIFVLFFILKLRTAILFSFVIIFINLPCIFIQRYNRARLKKLFFKKINRLENRSLLKL
ncbi:MAG: hypothetical protein LBJ32_04980 [Oscillospiraceae bacterium]|jgi:glycosyl-4,4'-diaponeurosporenoate acyltransferase|nr:hypothetical protein [Oscillospiraceae bacterium]